MDSLLSPEEINVLLQETSKKEATDVERKAPVELAEVEVDVLGEIANIFMGSAATALSILLGKKTVITAPRVVLATPEKIWNKYPQDFLTVNVVYESGLKGNNVFVLHKHDVEVFVDLMLRGNETELNDSHLEVINQAMEKMMDASAIALTQLLDLPIKMSAPVLNFTPLKKELLFSENADEPVVKIAFDLKVNGLLDSEMLQILPLPFAKQLVDKVLKIKELKQEVSDSLKLNSENKLTNTGDKQVEISPVELPCFSEENKVVQSAANLDLIMDISLELSVELGKTKKQIKEILELTNGSLVELNKLAGEPVDILVNGNHLAKGEVVVIDENFGVRVTEIVSPTERIEKLR